MFKGLGFDFFLVIGAIALTAVCWGAYGPVLHEGQKAMQGSRLRPLLCVGMAYFVIAVVVPVIALQLMGEKGDWNLRGIIWSSAGGAAGAIGALGIIMAFNFGGSPSYVMPLVFGCAPVVNAFLTIYWAGNWAEFTPIRMGLFFAGLILVAAGAVTVLATVPRGHAPGPTASSVSHAHPESTKEK